MRMSIEAFMLTILLSLAVWHDWHHRRIPNRLLQVFALMGFALSLSPSGLGLWSALPGALLGAGAFAPLYLAGQMGGGDIKLMATTGLLVGVERIAALCLAVALCGGLLALWWCFRTWRNNTARQATGDVLQTRMPYALAVAAGALAQGLHSLWPASVA